MSRNAGGGLGRWQHGRARANPAASPGRASARKWAAATLLSGLLIAVAVFLGWLAFQFLFVGGPRPHFVGIWVDQYQRPDVGGRAGSGPRRTGLSSPIPPDPLVAADRKALLAAKIFADSDVTDWEDARNPSREQVILRLEQLRDRKPTDAVVVYVAAHATIDAAGKVQVLALDSDPYQPGTLLPLSQMLDKLRACPARNKLLVLDIMRGASEPLDLGAAADGVADLVAREVLVANVADLRVLSACGQGQKALGSETLGGSPCSAFGHYFRLGLTDPAADLDQDNVVEVEELARYLALRVDQWARGFRGARQEPRLDGRGPNFALAATKDVPPDTPKSSGSWSWPWSKKAGAEKTADASKDAGDTQEKEKEKATANPKEKAVAKAAPPEEFPGLDTRGYPSWLAQNWALRAEWWRTDAFQAAPRVFRRLGAVLLRAEWRWRLGDDPNAVASELQGEVEALGSAMRAAQAIKRPKLDRSVAQARALGGPFDPAPGQALRALLVALPTPPGEKAKADADARKAGFLAGFEGKTPLDLAAAIVDAVAGDPLGPATLAYLDDLVTASKLPRDAIELRFLEQLARRDKAAPEGLPPGLAKRAWDAVSAAEKAGSRPDAFAWARGPLTRADVLRHTAEVLTLADLVGFVSPAAVSEAWDQARRALDDATAVQERVLGAQSERARALALLRAGIPYLDAIADPELFAAWSQTAEAVAALDPLLQRPGDASAFEPTEEWSRGIDERRAELARQSRPLQRPFEHEAIRDLVKQATTADPPNPALAHQIDALLATTLPPPEDRPRLWAAGRALARRLAPDVSKPPAGPAEPGRVTPETRGRLNRRFERMSALVRLAGDEANARRFESLRELLRERKLVDPSSPDDIWPRVGAFAFLAHTKLEELATRADPSDGRDRAGWVAPVFRIDWERNPTRDVRARDARDNWGWLAEHYIHQGRDRFDPELPDTPEFYSKAAEDCWNCDPDAPRASRLPPDVYLELIPRDPTARALAPGHPSDTVGLTIGLRGPAGDDRRKVALAVLHPNDPRLRVERPKPAELDVQPLADAETTVALAWDDDAPAPPGGALPRGFVIQARLPDQRTYHREVPVRVAPRNQQLRLVFGDDPAKPEPVLNDRLLLRPLPGRQAFRLFVRNPSSTPREVFVELRYAGGPNPPPAKVAAPAGATTPVPGFGPPVPKETDPLPTLTGPLRVVLRDGSAAGPILDDRTIAVEVATPDDYLDRFLEVEDPVFVPSDPAAGGINRLTVKVKALPRLTSPCTVKLELPLARDLFPALRAKPLQGNLEGQLEPGGSLTLTAEQIALDTVANPNGTFFLSFDRASRAIGYRAEFALEGPPRRAERERTARVRLLPPDYRPLPSPARLRVVVLTDNAPADASLRLRLARPGAERFDEKVWTPRPPRDRHVGFDPRGDQGALLFEADIRDWEHVFDVPGVLGERILEARLLDPNGRVELDRDLVRLTLDDQPIAGLGLAVPTPVPEGTPEVIVRAAVAPPASGVREMIFVAGAGTPAEVDKAKAEGKATPGQPKDATRTVWEAKIPLPKGATGQVLVTARFVSGTGLSGDVTQPIKLTPPPPPVVAAETTKDEAKPKEPPKPGAIEGTVVIGAVPQPGLDVYLMPADPKAKDADKPIDVKKTTPQGVFAFKDLPPGPYRLYSEKRTTNRRVDQIVEVEPGRTTAVTLSLLNR